MEILFLLGYIILFMSIFILIKNRINRIPIILYVVWWGVLFIISILNPYQLYPVSLPTYTLIFVNTLMFFIGYIIISYKKHNYQLKMNFSLFKLEKTILIIQIIIFPIMLYYVIKYQALLNSLGHTYARTIRYDLGLLFSSVYESALYSYILQPIILVTSILVAVKFINKDFKNFTFIIMLINVLLNTRIGLGRFGYFELILYLVIIYLLLKKKNGKKFTINKGKIGQQAILVFAGLVLITLMNYTMLIRRGTENISMKSIFDGYNLLFDQAISYFVGPFRALDYFLNTHVSSDYYFGRLTLGGIDHILGIFFKMIDSNYVIAYQAITPMVQDPIVIGYGKTFNAFYTSILNHYLDFNLIGIIIFPLLYGMIVAFVVNMFVKRQNVASLSIVVYFVYNSLMSSLNWEYESISAWFSVTLLFVLYIYSRRYELNADKKGTISPRILK